MTMQPFDSSEQDVSRQENSIPASSRVLSDEEIEDRIQTTPEETELESSGTSSRTPTEFGASEEITPEIESVGEPEPSGSRLPTPKPSKRRARFTEADVVRGSLTPQRGFVAPKEGATTADILEEVMTDGPSVLGEPTDVDRDILGIGVGEDPFLGSEASNLFIPPEAFLESLWGSDMTESLPRPAASVASRQAFRKPIRVGGIVLLQILKSNTGVSGYRVQWSQEEFDWYPEKETLIEAEARQ